MCGHLRRTRWVDGAGGRGVLRVKKGRAGAPGGPTARKAGSDGGGDDDDQLEMVWKMLANVWTELMAYLVPSTDEERLKGHENALVQGGDFITVLWALSTHMGISRQPV